MGVPFFTVLKVLPAIINSAGSIITSVNARRESQPGVKVEERIRKLEEDVVNTGKVITGLAEQVQAIAQELRAQAELNAARERQIKGLWIVAVLALASGIAGGLAAWLA